MMDTEQLPSRFLAAVQEFPLDARPLLMRIPGSGGMLDSRSFKALAGLLRAGREETLVRLLGLAAAYSVSPISNFRVGAVVAGMADEDGYPNVYLGANMEFPGVPLNHSIHAEQCAVANAWLRSEPGISGLAVTSPPCGYCRQFLKEAASEGDLPILVAQAGGPPRANPLSELLPLSFGPADLGVAGNLLSPRAPQAFSLAGAASGDELAGHALDAARESYAPYTGCFSGCAIRHEGGRVFTGRYAENAAFNPSLSPLQTALARMHMGLNLDEPRRLSGVALVEVDGAISQYVATVSIIGSIAAGLKVDYFQARV